MLWQPTRGILQPNQHWRRNQGAAAGFSAEAQQFIDRVTVSGAYQTRYATLIDTIVASAGLWAKIGNLKIRKAPDATTANTNLKSSSYPTDNTDALVFTADSGYSGKATAGTGLRETRPTELTQNSACYFFWTTNATAFGGAAMRGSLSTIRDGLYPFYTDNKMYSNLNSTVDDSVGKVITPAAGMYGGSRTNTTLTYYQNGVNRGTRTDTSQAVATGTLIEQFSASTTVYPGFAWGHLTGAALTDAEVTLIYNAFQAF
jgi:hypothetical protein